MAAALPTMVGAAGRDQAMQAAIHPVADAATLQGWLARVPVTRDFPDDFEATMRGGGPTIVIEMSTAPGCLPCGDLWVRLNRLARHYARPVRAITEQEAMIRSGRLGLPWVGHPVAWVRPLADPDRTIPIAIGTDHDANLARNIYLAVKMLTGVRPAVGVRAMAKYTGLVAPAAPSRRSAR